MSPSSSSSSTLWTLVLVSVVITVCGQLTTPSSDSHKDREDKSRYGYGHYGDQYQSGPYSAYDVDQVDRELYYLKQHSHFRDPFDGLVFVDKNEVLAFRAEAGNGDKVLDRYTEFKVNDDRDAPSLAALPCSCRRPQGRCGKHYRSRILDAWPASFFHKVKVTLYKDGEQVAFFDFNPEESTYLNFFSKKRLTNSSYDDVNANVNTITIKSGADHRHFLVFNVDPLGCAGQSLHMLVVDGPEACLPGKTSFPLILYSLNNGTVPIMESGNIGEADVLMMTVVLKAYGPDYRECFP